MTKNRSVVLGAVVLTGFLLIGFWCLNPRYGEVSPLTYECSKALYSACLNKSEEHLKRVEELLAASDLEVLPANERYWIEAIIAEAHGGDWQTAAKKARRMMEDQVKY